MKRFYEKAEAGSLESGMTVLLDGRPIKTPAKEKLLLPSEQMAVAIANEWDAQDEKVDPSTMPCMQYAATAIDRVTTQRDAVIDEICGYGGTDLVCYRASYPAPLVKKQSKAWDPLLEWIKNEHDISLKTTTGLSHVKQDEAALERFRDLVQARNDFELAAIHTIVSLTGSMVVTLAVTDGHLDGEMAFEVSELDETHVIEEWGEDAEAALRRKNNKQSLLNAIRFLTLCD
ncbi:ATP12 family chaperone protein [Sneathiella aquimaris]|uniref:ATP12 family chaperone protein n=1 Tax=Sneathiella aquimaris TaxID=2599305 RepID=UPI00146BD3AA|nr:ATP12 family protein [Sneathiella aquimaris]